MVNLDDHAATREAVEVDRRRPKSPKSHVAPDTRGLPVDRDYAWVIAFCKWALSSVTTIITNLLRWFTNNNHLCLINSRSGEYRGSCLIKIIISTLPLPSLLSLPVLLLPSFNINWKKTMCSRTSRTLSMKVYCMYCVNRTSPRCSTIFINFIGLLICDSAVNP